MTAKVRVLVVGIGKMGTLHALAYHHLDGFEIVGLCSLNLTRRNDLPPELDGYPKFDNFYEALGHLRPDAVSICTWPDSHAEYTLSAFEAGAHVFLEKPMAESAADAERVVAKARHSGRKLVVGYILRHHPSWSRLVDLSHGLGKPLVMRMALNQQSSGPFWVAHKHLMESVSPIVDCGVHYVDMMCLMTEARPIRVHAIGARLSDEIAADMYNYGQLQVQFDDGSVGWYESGWGPMMSRSAFFVQDIMGPNGSVSVDIAENGNGNGVDTHTRTNVLHIHHAELSADGRLAQRDETFSEANEPGRMELCRREQQYFLDAVREDRELASHLNDALNSLKIVLAADRSVRSGEIVYL